jgi:hypothetical protein
MKFLKKLTLNLIGLALVLCCIALTRSGIFVISQISFKPFFSAVNSLTALLIGFVTGILVCIILPFVRPLYVLEHELTHALWAIITGRKIKKIRISNNEGAVTMSGSNFLVALSPYFFPLYFFLVIVAYFILSIFLNPQTNWWLGATGFTFSFHFYFTLLSLLSHQSDIAEYGILFCYPLIYFVNVFLIISMIILMIPHLKFHLFINVLANDITMLFTQIWNFVLKFTEMI